MEKLIDGIYVKTYGKATNQPVVFIHGFPFEHTLYNNVIDEFKNVYYCISYDIRGFGNSKLNSAQCTIESYTEDLESMILRLKLDKPIICGFSMGGYIALRANEKLQKNYKALILANTTSSSDSDEAKLKRSAAISDIDAKGIEPFIDKFLLVAFSEDFIKKESLKIEEIKNTIMNSSSIGIKGALLAMASRVDTTKSLKDIDIPVLLISAENDKIISPDIMAQMANSIKKSTLVCLSGSGHMSMLEKPDEFNTALRRFLETL